MRIFISLCFFLSSHTILAQKNLTFSVVTFNVENLFDEHHDKGKDDLAYLPKSQKQTSSHHDKCMKKRSPKRREECLKLDWNSSLIEKKLKHIHKSILDVSKGAPPDIVILAEVENKKILDRLAAYFPQYQTKVLLEGSDPRGIDNAIMTRFSLLKEPLLHRIDAGGLKKNTLKRGILEAWFQVPGGFLLRAFAVHFPAPYHPREKRVFASYALNTLLLGGRAKGVVTIAAGDFNVTGKEDSFFYRGKFSPFWQVSHLVGCHECLGSYYYKKKDSWSFLDAILLEKSPKCRMLADSVRVGGKSKGSDHLPVYAKIRCKV